MSTTINKASGVESPRHLVRLTRTLAQKLDARHRRAWMAGHFSAPSSPIDSYECEYRESTPAWHIFTLDGTLKKS
jgi:hypothetical protein